MLPTLKHGDTVLARTIFFQKYLKPNQIVIFYDQQRSIAMIKRLVKITIENECIVAGDNTTESAQINPVTMKSIQGVVDSVIV